MQGMSLVEDCNFFHILTWLWGWDSSPLLDFCFCGHRWPSATLPKSSTPSLTATGCMWCTGTWSRRTWCSLRSRASSSSLTSASATGFSLGKNSTLPAAHWPTLLLRYCWGTSTTLLLWVSQGKWQSGLWVTQWGHICVDQVVNNNFHLSPEFTYWSKQQEWYRLSSPVA